MVRWCLKIAACAMVIALPATQAGAWSTSTHSPRLGRYHVSRLARGAVPVIRRGYVAPYASRQQYAAPHYSLPLGPPVWDDLCGLPSTGCTSIN
jgi:hypothetical protein